MRENVRMYGTLDTKLLSTLLAKPPFSRTFSPSQLQEELPTKNLFSIILDVFDLLYSATNDLTGQTLFTLPLAAGKNASDKNQIRDLSHDLALLNFCVDIEM